MGTRTPDISPMAEQDDHIVGDHDTQDMMAQGENMLHQAERKAEDLAGQIREGANSTVGSVGAGMKSLAQRVEANTPQEGTIGDAGNAVAVALREGGEYLEREGLEGIATDLTDVIRKYPMTAVMVGVGVGFLLARTGR